MSSNVTIKEISRYANVSTATVSRVLSDSPKVRPATRDRVLSVIREYGYEPNQVARNLTVRRTNTIGLIVESLANPFFVEIAQAAEAVLSEAKLTMLLMTTNWNQQKEVDSVRALLRNRVDGVLLTPLNAHSESVLMLERWGIPFVLINVNPSSDRVCTVSTDNYRGGYLAAQALSECDADTFVCLQGFPHESTFDRITGFTDAMNELHAEQSREVEIVPDVRTYQEGYDSVQRFIGRIPESGSIGVFATNDDVALGVLAALFDHGIRVPQQVSVVGYDDIPAASRFQIPLTTIAQPIREMGSIAAKDIISYIRDTEKKNQSHVLLPRLVQRASTLRVTGASL
jgi:LacI family transcriptional regulator